MHSWGVIEGASSTMRRPLHLLNQESALVDTCFPKCYPATRSNERVSQTRRRNDAEVAAVRVGVAR